ncbi:hypothetical protein V8C37DRAFT_88371 [Trichoderma ceciliae]
MKESRSSKRKRGPTEYLAVPCELEQNTRLGDPDRLAVAGRVEMSKRGEAQVISQDGEARRSSDDGVRRGLQICFSRLSASLVPSSSPLSSLPSVLGEEG